MSEGKCSDTNFCSLDLGQLPAFWAPWFPAMFPFLGRGRITTTTSTKYQKYFRKHRPWKGTFKGTISCGKALAETVSLQTLTT